MIRQRRYEISIPAEKIVEGSRLLDARGEGEDPSTSPLLGNTRRRRLPNASRFRPAYKRPLSPRGEGPPREFSIKAPPSPLLLPPQQLLFFLSFFLLFREN